MKDWIVPEPKKFELADSWFILPSKLLIIIQHSELFPIARKLKEDLHHYEHIHHVDITTFLDNNEKSFYIELLVDDEGKERTKIHEQRYRIQVLKNVRDITLVLNILQII
jgi:hypothetical protein